MLFVAKTNTVSLKKLHSISFCNAISFPKSFFDSESHFSTSSANINNSLFLLMRAIRFKISISASEKENN